MRSIARRSCAAVRSGHLTLATFNAVRRCPLACVCQNTQASSSRAAAQVRFASTCRAPLLRLRQAELRSSADAAPSPPLDWTIHDSGADECWAIIAPASEQGGAVRRELIDILAGRLRPRKASATSETLQHEPPHPFLLDADAADGRLRRSALHAIKHVSFATKIGAAAATVGAGEFTNYAARYGAIRDEDRVTLYERLMDLLDCPVGLVAAQKLVPDPLKQHADQLGRFKYTSAAQQQAAVHKAREADSIIRGMAPLLLIDDELLHRPVIALSNGQTRRARILSSLISGAELVVLEEPFSGIDVATRSRLSDLFAQLHAKRRPRFVLVLREQDALPDLVTHLVRIDDTGTITTLGPRSTSTVPASDRLRRGGVEVVRANADAGVGRGDAMQEAVVRLNDVSIVYGGKAVLDRVSLALHPGTRMVLAGDNGSGKTTLLALLLGDHPRSFSFDADRLVLFSHARDHASNARALLNRRLGHLSPELFHAFPRRPAAAGGLSIGEVVASGFENVFARRTYTEPQKQRVWSLLSLFADLIKSSPRATPEHGLSEECQGGIGDVRRLSARGFSELSHGSQAVVLFLRAVVSNPQLLVLDEPFQGMDQRQVERTRAFLDHPHRFPLGSTPHEIARDLADRQRTAIVLVSHYEAEWPTSFGALLRLADGQVIQRI